MTAFDHAHYIRRAVEVSRQALAGGNHPFGALLAGPDGAILLEQGNVEVTERDCTGHAETVLLRRAARLYDKSFLAGCTMYTTAEPCCMCSGAMYWAGVGRVVYGIGETKLKELTGDDPNNPTLDVPCRYVFARGQKAIEVIGPVPETEEEVFAVHRGYWKPKVNG